MESQQINENTLKTVLAKVDNNIKKLAGKKINVLRFDIGKNPNIFNYILAKAYRRVLATRLCDLEDEIDDKFLEKVKLKVDVL